MSAGNVQTIIKRAVAEPEFRGLLFRDPGQALAGYELSEMEIAGLCGLTADSCDGSAAEVEAVQQVIPRAAGEPKFRSLFFRAPAEALAGYALSRAEIASLSGLTPAAFDSLATEVERRLSMSLTWVGMAHRPGGE